VLQLGSTHSIIINPKEDAWCVRCGEAASDRCSTSVVCRSAADSFKNFLTMERWEPERTAAKVEQLLTEFNEPNVGGQLRWATLQEMCKLDVATLNAQIDHKIAELVLTRIQRGSDARQWPNVYTLRWLAFSLLALRKHGAAKIAQHVSILRSYARSSRDEEAPFGRPCRCAMCRAWKLTNETQFYGRSVVIENGVVARLWLPQ